MEALVFNYRSRGAIFFVAVYTEMVYCTCLLRVLFPRLPNGLLISPTNSAIEFWVNFFLGYSMLFALPLTVWIMKNCRVEIVGDQIISYDLSGRKQAQGRLTSARLVPPKERRNLYQRRNDQVPFNRLIYRSIGRSLRIQTEGGEIRIRTSINDFGLLKRIIDEQGHGAKPANRHSNYVRPLVCSYRWTSTQWFAIFWFCLSFACLSGVMGSAQINDKVELFIDVFVSLIIGVVMQLKAVYDEIRLGPGGIQWIDFRGIRRVFARLDEIVGLDEGTKTGTDCGMIFTTQGTIRLSSNIRGYSQLICELKKLVPSESG